MKRATRSRIERRCRAMLFAIAVIHAIAGMLATRPAPEVAPDATTETRCVIFAA